MASLSQQEMRNYLKEQWPHSRKWSSKVDRMPDQQVVAFYLRLQSQKSKKVA